jgi:hypothetical protein
LRRRLGNSFSDGGRQTARFAAEDLRRGGPFFLALVRMRKPQIFFENSLCAGNNGVVAGVQDVAGDMGTKNGRRKAAPTVSPDR